MSTTPNSHQAREWAHDVLDDTYAEIVDDITTDRAGFVENLRDIARYIAELPTEIVDGSKLREVIDTHFAREGEHAPKWIPEFYLNELLPEPVTLADMSEDERRSLINTYVHIKGWGTPEKLVAVKGDEGMVFVESDDDEWPRIGVMALSDLTPVDDEDDEDKNDAFSSLVEPEHSELYRDDYVLFKFDDLSDDDYRGGTSGTGRTFTPMHKNHHAFGETVGHRDLLTKHEYTDYEGHTWLYEYGGWSQYHKKHHNGQPNRYPAPSEYFGPYTCVK